MHTQDAFADKQNRFHLVRQKFHSAQILISYAASRRDRNSWIVVKPAMPATADMKYGSQLWSPLVHVILVNWAGQFASAHKSYI